MHELSLVQQIIEIAEAQVKEENAFDVEVLEIEIGDLAGVDRPAFDFAWQSAIVGTVLEKSECKIRTESGKAVCNDCQTDFAIMELYDACPNCGGFSKCITGGRALNVNTMVLRFEELSIAK